MAIRDVVREVAMQVRQKAGAVVEALEGPVKTHVVSQRAEIFRIPMPNGVPILARVTTFQMRRTFSALRDPQNYVAHEICTADRRGNIIHNGTGSLAEVLGYFIRKATDGFYDIRVNPSALSCTDCGGCGILGDDRCKVCDGTGMRPLRECVRHIALSLQRTIPAEDTEGMRHMIGSALKDTDELYARICERWTAKPSDELLYGVRACIIFYLGATARMVSASTQSGQSVHWDKKPVLAKAAAASGQYMAMQLSHSTVIPYHRCESQRFMALMGLESLFGGMTVDKLGMTIFSEVRPDGAVDVLDVWSPEFFKRLMADGGVQLMETFYKSYAERVNQIAWAIDSAAQTAGMLPGESLAAFIDRLRQERNEAQDKLSEALETIRG